MTPSNKGEALARVELLPGKPLEKSAVTLSNDDFFFLDDDIDSVAEAINAAHSLAVSEAVEKERDFATHVRMALGTAISALRTNDPSLHARALDIAKRSLDLEIDRDEEFRRRGFPK